MCTRAWTRAWPRAVALVLSAALVAPAVAPGVAFAQGAKGAAAAKKKSIRDELPEEARRNWDSAINLVDNGNWDGARADFLRAYEVSKNPRVLYNVAVCEKNRGKYAKAVDTLRRQLGEGAGKLSAEDEAQSKQLIAGLERFVSTLTVDVSEPGARILVDGEEVGVSPLGKAVSVEVGERRVSAIKAGFTEAARSVTVSGGVPASVSLKLESNVKTSLVVVNVTGPANAIVKVDGREVGPAPYKGQIPVSVEPHVFSAEAPGYVTASQSAVVLEGSMLNLTLALSSAQDRGKLAITARPDGALIEIDGRSMGATRWEGPVSAGTHQIAVKKPGYYTWTYDVEVPRGGERSLTAALNEDRNTSFVPWLIGSIVVIGASAVALGFILQPTDQARVEGSLSPGVVEH